MPPSAVSISTGAFTPAARQRRSTSIPSIPRQHAIEDDDIERLDRAEMQRILAGRDRRYDMAEFAKPVLDEPGGLGIIFGDQDAHRSVSVLVVGGIR